MELGNVTVSEYKGYPRFDFEYNGHKGIVIVPRQPRADRKWVWRTEFLGAFDSVDVEMLNRGFYLAHYEIHDMYGCPASVELMDGFYRLLAEQFGLAKKTLLFGFSRGGLYAFNFAAAYPDRAAALYLDAPVLDLHTWPTSYPREFAECVALYGHTKESFADFHDSPVDHMDVVATAGIPVALVMGDADEVVPYDKNGMKLAEVYRKAGLPLLCVVKPGCGHHPHSLLDPTCVVNFLLENC